MSLFDKIFKDDKEEVKTSSSYIYSPVEGEVIDISEVKDPVFSKKVMGDGFAVIPKDTKIISPMDAEVSFIAETKHGIGLKNDKGVELFIHLGLDTVNLKGEGFKMNVNQGDLVKKGDLLCKYDIDFIKDKGFDPTVIIVVTNLGDYANIKIDKNEEKIMKLY